MYFQSSSADVFRPGDDKKGANLFKVLPHPDPLSIHIQDLQMLNVY